MDRTLGRAALVALTFMAAAPVGGQVTTVITPARRPEAARADSVRQVEAARDSVARVTMTGMKEWVDSAAAALAVRPDTARSPAADSAAAAVPPAGREPEPATGRRDEGAARGEFREGAPAPDTATSLPAFALLGGVLLVVGAALLLRRPARARDRTISSRSA